MQNPSPAATAAMSEQAYGLHRQGRYTRSNSEGQASSTISNNGNAPDSPQQSSSASASFTRSNSGPMERSKTLNSATMQQQQQFPMQQYQSAPHGTPPLRPHKKVIQTGLKSNEIPQEQQHRSQQQQQLGSESRGNGQSRQGYRRQRKSRSSNAALQNGGGGYGSFWGNRQQPQHPQQQHQHMAYPAPLPSSNQVPSSGGHHVRRGSWAQPIPNTSTSLLFQPRQQQQQSPASSPRSAMTKSLDPRVNEIRSLTASLGMSPRASPKVPPNVLSSLPEYGQQQQQQLLLPPAVAAWANNPNYNHNNSVGSSGSGQYSNTLRRSKSESTRRKHLRTHSAQVLMETCKGTVQPLKCRNVGFLVLFVIQLLCVAYLGSLYFDYAIFTRHEGSDGRSHSHHHRRHYRHSVIKTASITMDDENDNDDEDAVVVHYENLLYIASLCGAFAMSLSAVTLGIMTILARRLVQVALVVVITLSFVWGTIGIGLSPHNFVPITGIIALALSVAYAVIVWDRIPFASANVLTALTAVRTYPTLTVLALLFQTIALVWSMYFCVVTIGVYDAIQEGTLVVSKGWTIALYSALGISYYWTFQVISNTLKVCTGSVVGSWWHNLTEPRVVSKAVFNTVFFSMGSICYGSLFVGPANIIRQVAIIVRPSTTDEVALLCLHECFRLAANRITIFVDSLTVRFNHWAFTYMGLYHYGFADAARKSADLFEKRGWTTIVSDDLVPNILLITSLVIGGMTGCFAGLLEWIDVLQISSLEEPGLVSFAIGAVIGIVLASILFSIIHSSVNTVLVCFAAEPVDFQDNHPQLSDEMREAWREVWPGALDVVDMRLAIAQARRCPSPVAPLANGSLTPPFLV